MAKAFPIIRILLITGATMVWLVAVGPWLLAWKLRNAIALRYWYAGDKGAFLRSHGITSDSE